MLEIQGHEVFEATDGAAGLRIALEIRPEAAVDIGLPVMDGYELARQIRRQAHQPGRLLAVTGYGRPEDHRRALKAGFDDHMVKPVDPETISRTLAEA